MKILFILLALILSASPNMMNFVRTVWIMRTYGDYKAYCDKEVQSYGKLFFIQSIVENGWWGDAFPTSLPGSAPETGC